MVKTFNVILVIFISTLVLVIGYWALWPNISPSWTGFGAYDETILGPRSKTLWDWLDLLVVPIFLALGAYLLSNIEKQTEQIIEVDRQRQNILTTFITQISTLLLENKLRTAKSGSEIRSIARTYTRTALRNLDAKRKAEALQFLSESGLIQTNPIISLIGANLEEIDLRNASLIGVEIKGARFDRSNFANANLSSANFTGSVFSDSNFEGASLEKANFSYAILKNVKFNKLDLTKTNLEWANLEGADLTGALITNEQLNKLESTKKAKLPKTTQ